MKCEHPIQLKNGLVVPCGKCLLCLSSRRDEWSVRLQLHSEGYSSMPFFVTLTYDPKNLVYGNELPTLVKSHLQLFIKRLKDKYDLYNTRFSFFACGEYGDPKLSNRPHYHLLLFGFDQLQETYEKSWIQANKMLADSWKLGFVDIGVAQWSGIHYVTKYVLKYDESDYEGIEKPFLLCSQGLGLPWLQSRQGKFLRSRLNLEKMREVLDNCPELDATDIKSLRVTAGRALAYLNANLPGFRIDLPNGSKAYLPRYIRRKLVGSFECLHDNPYDYPHFLQQIIDSTDYIDRNRDYDLESDMSISEQLIQFTKLKIRQRLLIKKSMK